MNYFVITRLISYQIELRLVQLPLLMTDPEGNKTIWFPEGSLIKWFVIYHKNIQLIVR